MNPSSENFQAAVWYVPGKTTFNNKRGTLSITQDAISMVDPSNQQVFAHPLSTVRQAKLGPGKIKITTDAEHFYLFFYNLRQEMAKVGAAGAVAEAGNLAGNPSAGQQIAGDMASAAIAKSSIRDIETAAPIVDGAAAVLRKYGVAVNGTTDVKRTKIIAGIIIGLLVVFAFVAAYFMNR